jgi:CspA family cold shock protein
MGRGGPDIGKRADTVAREHAPDPLAPVGTKDSGEGTVAWWNSERGYGAVSVEKIAPWDVWCHFSRIDAAGYRELTPGERVQIDYYRADQESFKYVASKVSRSS